MPFMSSTMSKNISLVLYRSPVALQGIGDENGVADVFASLKNVGLIHRRNTGLTQQYQRLQVSF
jgi:hypothetical protein